MTRLPLLLLSALILCSGPFVWASPPPAVCPCDAPLFLYDLRSQCPLSISPHPPLQVDGNFLDRALSTKQRNTYTSVLFYASWCPFSHRMHPKFEMLGSMFPQMEHLTVEQSSALPSIFSRYGIHSFPSILLINQTSKVWYHGPKDLQSLVKFYEKTTGFEPVQHIAEDQLDIFECENCTMKSVYGSSLEEIMKREPYLVFATLFLCLRVVLFLSPKLFSRVKAFYGSYVPHFNLEIFGETSQLFGRILHMIDVRRIWTKLRLCKTRNFHESAKNCRVWASSLASVSLGESSSSGRS